MFYVKNTRQGSSPKITEHTSLSLPIRLLHMLLSFKVICVNSKIYRLNLSNVIFNRISFPVIKKHAYWNKKMPKHHVTIFHLICGSILRNVFWNLMKGINELNIKWRCDRDMSYDPRDGARAHKIFQRGMEWFAVNRVVVSVFLEGKASCVVW